MTTATLNIFTEEGRKYQFVDFFTRGMNPQMARVISKDLDAEDAYDHIQHARELQAQAARKQQDAMFKKLFGF